MTSVVSSVVFNCSKYFMFVDGPDILSSQVRRFQRDQDRQVEENRGK